MLFHLLQIVTYAGIILFIILASQFIWRTIIKAMTLRQKLMESDESFIDIPNMNPGLGNNFLVKTAKWPMVPLGTDSQCDSNVIYILL